MKVVIINPTYNEKGNIEKLIGVLEEDIFPQIKNHDMHILIADDMSPDGTANVVKDLMKKYKNLHIVSGPKQGLGAAYIRAMDYAIDKLGADVVFEMDADGQHDPSKIPLFLKKIDNGADFVLGTRYSEGGSIPQNWPPQRKAFSIVANLLVRTIFMEFSIHDWTGGYRALRKEVFLKEREKLVNFNGYIFQISFLHKAVRDGFKIAEVPFHFTDRTLGKSKIAPLGYIYDVLSYVIISRIKELARFIKFLIVGGTGFIVQVTLQEVSIRVGLTMAIALALQQSGIHFGNNIDEFSHGIGASIGAESAILSNFFWNNLWTFQDTKHIKEQSGFFVRLVKFNFTSLASIFIQFLAVFFGELVFGDSITIFGHSLAVRILILFPTIIFLVIPLNYIIYNKFIWKTQHLKHGKDLAKEN